MGARLIERWHDDCLVSGKGMTRKGKFECLRPTVPSSSFMCETRIETFADCPNIAIVGEGAYNADIGASRIEEPHPDFLYTAGERRDTTRHRVDGPERS